MLNNSQRKILNFLLGGGIWYCDHKLTCPTLFDCYFSSKIQYTIENFQLWVVQGREWTTLCNVDPLTKVLILWKRKLREEKVESTYVMGSLERFSNQLVCTCKLSLTHSKISRNDGKQIIASCNMFFVSSGIRYNKLNQIRSHN